MDFYERIGDIMDFSTEPKTDESADIMVKTVTQRETWAKWSEFFFSIVGLVVGISNIWRFPYMCYINGGGAFLIPFFIFMILIAIPIMLLENAVAQFANLGPGKIWVICPLFKGVGAAMVIICAFVGIYYNVIIAWVLYYLYSSMYPILAWSSCNNTWNTHRCYETISMMKNYQVNSTLDFMLNSTTVVNVSSPSLALKSSVEEYWERHVLNLSPSINNPGAVRLPLLLCLFLIWLLTFLCLAKGIKTSGKVAYVAVILPYVFLIILLIRSLTLPGSLDGIYYFVKPNWEKLKEISVWKDAAIQILYSIGVGMGSILTLASYNDFHYNCQSSIVQVIVAVIYRVDFLTKVGHAARDAIILPILDGATSFLSGLTSFSMLGYMAHIKETDIDNVIDKGPGITFIVYPQALSTLPIAQLWAVMFFATLVLVGLDSQFGHVQTIVTAITDVYPERFGNHKTILTGIVCVLGFIFGITCITEGGLYVLQMVDWYCASLSFFLILFIEMIGIVWIYGATRLENDISQMLGRRPWPIWKPLWMIIDPVCIVFIWIFGLISFKHLTYGDGTMFPKWTNYAGWGIALFTILPVPIFGVQQMMKHKGSFVNRLKESIKPTPEWCPAKSRGKLKLKDISMPGEEIDNQLL